MKIALITGGSRGIGSAISTKFASNGYNIIINYVESDESAIKLKEELTSKYKINVDLFKCDISDEKKVEAMILKIEEKYGKIDVLVNNAGIAIDTLFFDKTKENFMKILEVNLVGTFLVSKYVGKLMLKYKSGKIINISSTNGIDTYYPFSIDYDASKAGVISLTHNLALEYSPYINVNCVASGWVNTDMNRELEQEFKNKEIEKIYLKRFAEPSEIANAVYFLASDESSYINNTVIRVDGGF